MARRTGSRRRRYRRPTYRGRSMSYRPRRFPTRKKNWFFTKIPTTVGSARYQVKQLTLPSKAALGLIVAGAVMGSVAVSQAAALPAVGRYAAMFAALGAKIAKKG